MGTKAAMLVLLLLLLLGLLQLLLVLEQHITGFKGFMVKLYCFSFFWRCALPPPTRIDHFSEALISEGLMLTDEMVTFC